MGSLAEKIVLASNLNNNVLLAYIQCSNFADAKCLSISPYHPATSNLTPIGELRANKVILTKKMTVPDQKFLNQSIYFHGESIIVIE